MRYINIETNKIVGINTIRRENKNISIPEGADCIEFGYKVLIETEKPTQDGFYAVEAEPVDSIQQWKLVEEVVHVPQSITPRQARIQLSVLGKLSLVETAIANLEEPDKSIAQIEWEYATVYEIDHPFIIQMAGLLEIDLEEFLIAAAKL